MMKINLGWGPDVRLTIMKREDERKTVTVRYPQAIELAETLKGISQDVDTEKDIIIPYRTSACAICKIFGLFYAFLVYKQDRKFCVGLVAKLYINATSRR